HGSAAAAIVIASGVYEFTPLKQRFRRRCCDSVRSGFEFGLRYVGSSIGLTLMLMLVALGGMSVTRMAVIAGFALAEKLLPAKAAIDVPLALVIVGLGILIVIAPGRFPDLCHLCSEKKERNNDGPQDRNTGTVACRSAGATQGREGADAPRRRTGEAAEGA